MSQDNAETTPTAARTLKRTTLTPSGARISSPVQVDTSQKYFDAVCKQLAKKDKASRIRHLRTNEAAFTLRKLMNIGLQLNREVGLFYDTVGKPRAGNATYSRLCLYAADDRLTLSGSATSKNTAHQAAAYISPPPDANPNRYTFIAHFHPSTDRYVEQLKNDIKHATQQVELVVNQDGLILYYNKEDYYNQTEVSPRGKLFLPMLKPVCDASQALSLDTPLDGSIRGKLNGILKPTVIQTPLASHSSTPSLFDEDLDIAFSSSDDEDTESESNKQIAPINTAPHHPLFRAAPPPHSETKEVQLRVLPPTRPQK